MKFRRRGYEEAEAEALRIAEAFVAADPPKVQAFVTMDASKVQAFDATDAAKRWYVGWRCGRPEPNQSAAGFDRRKPVVKWKVWVRPIPQVGCTIDGGDGFLLVDIETKEARWSEFP